MKIKFLLLLLYSACAIFPLHAQFRPDDVGFNLKEHDLYKKAGIKTRIETMIDTAFGGSSFITAVTEYSEEGWLYRITYNEVLEGYDMDEDGVNDTIMDEFTYYPDGRIRIIYMYGYDLYPIQYAFEYDKKNKLINSSIASAEARRYRYEYDKNDRIVRRIGQTYFFEYDDEGNMIDQPIWVDYDSSTYVWNAKDQLISEKFYMMEQVYYRVDYYYNANGLLDHYDIFYDMSEGAEPSYKNSYTYNEKGIIVKMVTEEPGLQIEYRYEYTYY
jgi:YD repeat-containing protein